MNSRQVGKVVNENKSILPRRRIPWLNWASHITVWGQLLSRQFRGWVGWPSKPKVAPDTNVSPQASLPSSILLPMLLIHLCIKYASWTVTKEMKIIILDFRANPQGINKISSYLQSEVQAGWGVGWGDGSLRARSWPASFAGSVLILVPGTLTSVNTCDLNK